MPTALVFTLRPETAGRLPEQGGRNAHAAVLELIGAAEPALAAALHADERVKPLTVAPVLGRDGRPADGVTPERDYELRVTLLDARLEALGRGWEAAPPATIALGGIDWRVVAATCDTMAHPWAGRAAYEELIASALRRSGPMPTRWALEFASPVTFRQRGLNQPLPLPELVFGSLLDKWNALAPLPLPDEIRGFVAEHVAISGLDLRSVMVPIKGGALQIGAVGRCAYTIARGDHAWAGALDLLARFAFYSGVGAGAARGFGQARLAPARPEIRPAVERRPAVA